MKHASAVTLMALAMTLTVQAQYLADNNTPLAAIRPLAPIEITTTEDPSPAPAIEWRRTEDIVMGHIRAASLARLQQLSASVMGCFQECYLSDGVGVPVWHAEYFPASGTVPVIRFGVRCLFFEHEEDNRPTPNDLTVFANDISPLLGSYKVNGQRFTALKGYAGGCQNPRFEFDVPANPDMDSSAAQADTLHVKAWLVTADSTHLPYIPVTRKEYLEIARLELQGKKDSIIAEIKSNAPIRSAEVQEAEKQQALRELALTYSGMELDTRTRIYLKNYLSDADYLQRTIDHHTATLDHTIRLIDSLLRTGNGQQLTRPAVVSATPEAFRGFEDGHPGAAMLVRLDANFFSGNTDSPAPKCFLVCWRYDPAGSLAGTIDRQLARNFDGEELRRSVATSL